ncbi:MAG TPA: hypothetical protein VM120_20630 [Bryobacteraceae bacterium]|nr:hypothetical protein [Bryobacteraceae bacterium]
MRKRIWTGLAAVLLTAVPLAAQKPEAAESLLQSAIKKEVVDGNLAGAIEGYKKALVAAKGNRPVAARALVQMAECYQKLGDAQSRAIYDQVVRDYADQKDAVAKARVRLGGIAQPGRQTNTLVWSGPKVNGEGSVSPDGRYLSYTEWDSGDLALHEIATGTERRLTDTRQQKSDVNVFAEGSAISKDGKQIAYNWWENKKAELRLASLTGNPSPRHLYENPEITWYIPFDWSPDGKSLVVFLQRTDRTKQIGLISIPGGSLRVLKSIDWRGTGRIRFSPDGKYLGYDLPQSDTGPARDVFILSVDGAREIHSVAHPSNDTMMGWSPDGKWLLFASDRTGSMALWGLPIADGKPQGAPELLRADFAARAEPIGITQAGAMYYAIKGSQDRYKIQIASIDFAAGKYLSKPMDLTQDYLESHALPTWSPDGRQLAYKSVRGLAQKPSHEVVLIRSMDTGQVRELRPKLSYFGPMTWAPDGRSFLTLGGISKAARESIRLTPRPASERLSFWISPERDHGTHNGRPMEKVFTLSGTTASLRIPHTSRGTSRREKKPK